MSVNNHDCVFCDRSFAHLKELVAHLVTQHRYQTVTLPGKKKVIFKVYNHQGRRILCFCGNRFTCFLTPEPAPAFLDWAMKVQAELDEYAAHLKREGGTLAAHLQRIRDAALLEHIEKAGLRHDPISLDALD